MVFESVRNKAGERPETIQMEGRDFIFVTSQRGGQSAVYKSQDSFMRIGDPEKIRRDFELHKKMEQAGFPVSRILAEGESEGQFYFIEASLGEKHLGKIFGEEVERGGVISNESFEAFVTVAEKFARAQMSAVVEDRDYQVFSKGLLLENLCNEMPDYADRLRERFELVKERTASLPFVLTHGDFNPQNLLPGGVIDLEDSFYAPYGYDLVSAISHINYFPDSKEYEYFAKYRFTNEQKQEYFRRLDIISVENGLPPLSEFEEDFEFCRALWLVADNPNSPKLAQFRYDLIIDKFLKWA